MFDGLSQRYPKKWSEMSLDYKLMFGYHLSVMALFVTGRSLRLQTEIVFTGFLVMVLVTISLWHRSLNEWRWPTVSSKNILGALLGALAIAFFAYAANPGFPPSDPQNLPWYLGVLGIGTFGILSSLRVVDASEAEFQQSCRIVDEYGREVERVPAPPKPADNEPAWKKTVRGIYSAAFVLIWVLGVASFFFSGTAFRNGAREPTAERVNPMTEHAVTVYIRRAEKERIDDLRLASAFGIPLILVSGVVLHFLVGVKLFPNTPTLAEFRAQRSG